MRLAISIIRRCLEGSGVQLMRKVPHGFTSLPHRCHNNVREWVAMQPSKYTHVKGFLVADRRPLADSTLVMAHSAVGTHDGALHDITPSELDVDFPFVRHLGTPEEFELIAGHSPFMVEVPHSVLFPLLGIPWP